MSKIVAAVTMKCPRCRKGDLFVTKNPYAPGKMFEMNESCSHCEMKYERETGFFFGAMYISYMLNMALFVTAVVGYFLFFQEADWRYYISIYVGLTIVLTPIIYRLSRSIWIEIMVKYEPEKRGKYSK